MPDVIKVTLVNRVPNSVTVSTGVSGGGTWGTISGTITDQSDLVTYVADEISQIPVPTDPDWGNIGGTITDQTDLVTYVADEIADIPTPATPTLQSVTDEGNTTTNSIGIGTSSPDYPLHVAGNSLVTGTQFIGDTFTRIQQGSGNLLLSNSFPTGGVVIRTNGVEKMRVDADGKVGIGTTAPNYKLDVFGYDENGAINSNVAFNISRVVKPDLSNTTATLQAGTELPLANMYYSITYYNAIGTTERGGYVTILPTSGNQRVLLENLPISPDPSVIGRKIYRNKSTDSSSYGALIATISDNTTTSYLDSLPESDPVFSGHIFSRSIWNMANTTTNFVSVDDVRSMVVDPNLTVFGYNAGQDLTRAGSTTLIGSNAGANITYGSGNTIIGYNSGRQLTTGPQNVLIGDNAGAQNLTTGGYNIALGPNTLKCNGSHNIAMGYYTGQSLGSGSGNILLGSYIAQGTSVNLNEAVVIGKSASVINGSLGQVNINNLIFGNRYTQRVGIGTTDPVSAFHVNADNNDTSMGMRISNQNAGGRAGFTFHLPNNNNQFYSFGVDNDRNFKISESNNLTTNNLFTFTPSGNVGIGTTAPSGKLHIRGDNNQSTTGVVEISTSGTSLRLGGNSTYSWIQTHSSKPLYINELGNNVILNAYGGNVGIGTTSPTEKLHVEGNAFIKNNLHVEGDLTIGKISNDSALVDVGGNFNFDTVAEVNTTDAANFVATILNVAGNINNGSHTYTIIYKTADGGETGAYHINIFKTITIVDNTTAGQVELTGIPVSTDARVVARDIYRSSANDSPYYGKKLATLNDNTTTTYVDNLPDSSLDQNTLFYRKANTTAGVFYINNKVVMQAPNVHRTSLGVDALKNNTIGQDNVAIGGSSLSVLTNGKQNTAVGYATGSHSIDGQNNTFIGYSNGYYNDSGDWNTYVGSFAG